ncbi:MAG: carboxylate-amine ligase [Wenzhouxiangella sp.]
MPTLEPLVQPGPLHAFAGYGIELEYMIVDRLTLAARPLADTLLKDAHGEILNELEHGLLAWSNELVMHVIELKTNGPAARLDALAGQFHADLLKINQQLLGQGAQLLSTACHPLFDPDRETRLWPHGQNEIYAAYDRIFGCRGHGWSNLQSMHINLPFYDDAEFRRLHAAIRVALPLIPALAAASPLEQGQRAPWLNNRLRYYRDNQRLIPEISGQVIPEPVDGIADYHAKILEPMYRAIAPFDPAEILREDWLNSRAAIARFERQAIEIRIIDLQEAPRADLAVAEAVVGLVRAFYQESLASFDAQQAINTDRLAAELWKAAAGGSAAVLDDPAYLDLLGLGAPSALGQVWRELLPQLELSLDAARTLEAMLDRGTLAEAIIRRLGITPTPVQIVDCYREIGQCLIDNRLFLS